MSRTDLFDAFDDRGASRIRTDHDLIERYDIIMKQEFDLLHLSDGERGLITEVLNLSGPAPLASPSLVLSLDYEVAEAMRSKGLVERWGVDPPTLVRKLRQLSPAQKCAIVEAHERGCLRTRGRSDAQQYW